MSRRARTTIVGLLVAGALIAPARPATAADGPPDASAWYFEIDGDYGSSIADTNQDDRDLPYHPLEVTDGGYQTYGRRSTGACTDWYHYRVRPYMGAQSYAVSCADPGTETRRSEQMMLANWKGGPDSERYFTFAFRLRDLPPSLPDGNRGYLAQLHQGSSGAPPFRLQWATHDGKYHLEGGTWKDSKDAQGRLDWVFTQMDGPQIVPGQWYRVLIRVDLGPTAGIASCPDCPGDSGSVTAWFMDNQTGAWVAFGSYSGRVGHRYFGAEGDLDPPFRSSVENEYQWKLGQYVNTQNHTTDYDNAAYGKRWNNITKNRLVGHHKSVLALPFDEAQGTTVHDSSWSSNGGEPGDAVTDYDNDGRIVGSVRRNVSGARNRSLAFDGTTYVEVPMDTTDFDVGNYVTVSAWFRTTARSAANKGLVMIDENADEWKVLLYGSDRGLSFGVRHPDGTYSKANQAFPVGRYNDGAWHQVVGTFNRFAADGQRVKLYIDGARVLQTPGADQPVLRGDHRLTVGKFSEHGYFIGDIDEVNLLNYALTDAEVENLWLRRTFS